MSKRVVIGGLVFVVALLVAGTIWVLASLDAIVKAAIEREGTRAVGAQVRVDSVELTLTEGRGVIRGLRVANPEGFGEGNVLDLAEIELDLDVESLQQPPIRLQRVRIEETTVQLEMDERGRTNLDAIVRHAREAPAEEPAAEAGAEPMRLAIDRLEVAGGTVIVERPGAEATRVDLPGFQRTGLGGSQGATSGELAQTLAQSLGRQVASSAASGALRDLVEKEVGGSLDEEAGRMLKGLLGGQK